MIYVRINWTLCGTINFSLFICPPPPPPFSSFLAYFRFSSLFSKIEVHTTKTDFRGATQGASGPSESKMTIVWARMVDTNQ